MSKSIMALPDIHTDPAARQKAWDMLSSVEHKPGVFYIEWSKPIDPSNLDASFAGLALGDARPTLKDLAALAISRGIPVVPVDMPAKMVKDKLDELSPDYAPHSDSSLFQPWGEAVRDVYTAKKIADDIGSRRDGTIGVLMYGADHFKPKRDGDTVLAESLDKLIRSHGEADVYNIKLTYGQEQSGPSASASAHESASKEEHKSGPKK